MMNSLQVKVTVTYFHTNAARLCLNIHSSIVFKKSELGLMAPFQTIERDQIMPDRNVATHLI